MSLESIAYFPYHFLLVPPPNVGPSHLQVVTHPVNMHLVLEHPYRLYQSLQVGQLHLLVVAITWGNFGVILP